MIKKIDPIDHIRRNVKMYLGRTEVVPEIIVSFIVNDAIVLGAKNVIVKNCSDWWLIASEMDWLRVGNDNPILQLFQKFVTLEGGGQNAVRREIILSAFANNIITWDDTCRRFSRQLSDKVKIFYAACFSGFNVTVVTGHQLRVRPDQRSGCFALAC